MGRINSTHSWHVTKLQASSVTERHKVSPCHVGHLGHGVAHPREKSWGVVARSLPSLTPAHNCPTSREHLPFPRATSLGSPKAWASRGSGLNLHARCSPCPHSAGDEGVREGRSLLGVQETRET